MKFEVKGCNNCPLKREIDVLLPIECSGVKSKKYPLGRPIDIDIPEYYRVFSNPDKSEKAYRNCTVRPNWCPLDSGQIVITLAPKDKKGKNNG